MAAVLSGHFFLTLANHMSLILLCTLGLILTKEKKRHIGSCLVHAVILNIVAGIEDLYLLATIGGYYFIYSCGLLVSQRGEQDL